MTLVLRLFARQFQRELLIQVRQIRFLLNSSLFFLIFLIMFPVTLKPEVDVLRMVIPGLVWMGVLLSALLCVERLFQQDYEQGVMEQWLVSGEPLALMVSAKIIANWFVTLIPLVLLCPLIALLFALNVWETWILVLTLILGTPALLYLCALVAAFGVGISQRGILMALVLLPLTLPLLIFGSGTLHIAMQGFPVNAYLALLLAMSLLAIGFLPYAIAGVIRITHAE